MGASLGTCLKGGHPGVPQGSSPRDSPFRALSRPPPGLPLRAGGSRVGRSVGSTDRPSVPPPHSLPPPPPRPSPRAGEPHPLLVTSSGEEAPGRWEQRQLLQGGSRGEAQSSAAAPCWDHIPSTTQGPPSSPGGSPWPVSEVLVLPAHAGRLPSGKSTSAGLLWPPPSGVGAASEARVTALFSRVTLAVRLPNSTHADKADLQDPQLPAARSSLH